MAKGKTKHRRDAASIARNPYRASLEVLERFLPDLPINSPVIRSPLTSVEDHRTWHPDPIQVAKSSRRRHSQIYVPKAKRPVGSPHRATLYGVQYGKNVGAPLGRSSAPYVGGVHQLAFRGSKFVVVCVRRKQRREVLHAIGKSGGGKQRGRRNQWSNVRC